MKRRKSSTTTKIATKIATKTDKKPSKVISKKNSNTNSAQKSIKSYFSSISTANKSSLSKESSNGSSSNSRQSTGNANETLFSTNRLLNDSDSDIECLNSPIKSKRQIERNDEIIIIKENFKRVRIEKSATSVKQQLFEDSIDENLEIIKPKIPFNSSSSIKASKSTDSNDLEEMATNDFKLSSLFQTPLKKSPVEYPFDLACPSPYFKNFSDTMSNQSFKDINDYLSIHLDDINQTKSPKSDPKKTSTSLPHNAETVKRELSFCDSPTKSDAKDQKLNLTNKKELTYSEINRKNFNTILKKTIDDPLNRCLFNEEDCHTIAVYTSLSYDAQSLFLRLLFRKNAWIKRSSVKHDDFLSNLEELLEELIRSKFLINLTELHSFEEGLYILDLAELKDFATSNKISITGQGKKKIIQTILNHVRKTNTLNFVASKMSLEERKLIELKKILGDRCFKVNMDNAKVFLRVLFLYFPPIHFEKNLNTTLSETFFNLYESSINLSTYPPCDSNKTIQVYKNRRDLVIYTDACILESMINENSSMTADEVIEYAETALLKYEDYIISNLKLDMNLPYFLRKLTAGQKLLCCISQCVTLLEKNKRYQDANRYLELLLKQNVYCLSSRGKWYDRLITNYESHLKDEKKAYEFCSKAFEDYYVRKAQELVIHKKSARLVKKLKIDSAYPFPKLNIPTVDIEASTIKRKIDLRNNVFYQPDRDGFTVIKVEQVALNHYLDELGYTNGLHCENTLYNNVFFLLFYNQIFIRDEKIKDIYRFEFQRLPLDFGTDLFFESRREHFQARFEYLNQLSYDGLHELIETEYEKYKSMETIIRLDSITLSNLKEIIFCMKMETLLNICRRLAEDHRFTRSGFPDLIVWNYEKRKIKAVEVKGPGDSSSEKQMIWIDFLNQAGLESEVCHVKAKK